MKTKILMLTVLSMLVTALPFATAEDACYRTGSTEAINHPTTPGSYLYLDLTHPEKVGEWIEHNGQTGLQTLDCFRFGILRFRADLKSEILG